MDKDCPVEKEDVSVWVTCKLKSEGWKEASKDGRVRGKAFQVEGTASAKMLRCSDSEVAQLCPALCDPVVLQPTRLLCPWDSPGRSTGVGCHCLLQGIFPTQKSNPGLSHCRQTLYHLSHQGSPNGGRDHYYCWQTDQLLSGCRGRKVRCWTQRTREDLGWRK